MKQGLNSGLYAAFDIGSCSIKAAIIERLEGRNRLAAIESEPLKPLSDFPGEAEHRDHQVQILKLLSQRLPLKDCRESLCLFNHRELQIKIIELPKEILPDQVDGVLMWEAKKLLSPSLKSEPFLFAYKQVRDLPPAYALTVITQERIQKLHELFNAAGIRLNGAYPEAFSSLAIRESLPSTGLPSTSVINLGHFNTHIQIFSSGELKFYRHIPSGVSEMSDRNDPKEFEALAQKIRFSFDYFRAVSKLPHIDETMFMGGGACHKDFIKFSRDYFAPGKVAHLDLSSVFDVSPVLAGLGGETFRLLPFLPGLGVFLAHAAPESARANFAARFQLILDTERTRKLASFVPAVIGTAGLALLLLIFFFMHQRVSLIREEARQAASIADLAAAGTRAKVARLMAKTVHTELTELERRTLIPLLRDRLSGGEILYKIGVNKPEDLVLHSIGIQGKDDGADSESSEADALPPEEAREEDLTASGDASLNQEPLPTPIPEPTKSGPDEGKETLGEEILVIKGYCESFGVLLEYAEKLKATHLIRRYRLFQTARKPGDRVRFTILGELP